MSYDLKFPGEKKWTFVCYDLTEAPPRWWVSRGLAWALQHSLPPSATSLQPSLSSSLSFSGFLPSPWPDLYQYSSFLTLEIYHIRMENISTKSSSSQAKILGTLVSISGAFVALYKGRPLHFRPMPPTSLSLAQPIQSNWVLGGSFLMVEYLLVPLWYIVQVPINDESIELLSFHWSDQRSFLVDADHERVPSWTNRGLLLQPLCLLQLYHCRSSHWTRPTWLESDRDWVGFGHLFSKTVM